MAEIAVFVSIFLHLVFSGLILDYLRFIRVTNMSSYLHRSLLSCVPL